MTVSKAQDHPPEHVINQPCTVCNAKDVHTADLDGDGRPDVLSASAGDDKIAWYKNKGDGFVSDQHVITTKADGAVSVFTADLDSDGDQDVLSASHGDGKIAWYENNGSGSFSAQQIITTRAGDPLAVYAADLDGDSRVDVISSGDGKVGWYQNQGDGSFSSEKVITTSVNRVRSIYAADISGDGRPDVLAAQTLAHQITWYENQTSGGGGFSDGKVITTEVDKPTDVHAADVDLDGDMDVLSTSSKDDKVAWYENTGNGAFSTQNLISVGVNKASTIHVGDLNGDGFLDVVALPRLSESTTWFENIDGESFSAGSELSTGDRTSDVHVADLGDGALPEILSAEFNRITLYTNQIGEEGGFSSGSTINIPPDVINPQALVAADLTGDDDPDVLTASMLDHNVVWYENTGNGSFSDQRIVGGLNKAQSQSISTADLDGDNDQDIAAAGRGAVFWYENRLDEESTFILGERLTTKVTRPDIHTGDLNGDGKIDVVSASAREDEIAWYRNEGDGSFSSQEVISNNGAISVYVADLDGDANPDILSSEIAWYKNEGNGSFSDRREISTDGSRLIYPADLDSDGDLDILSVKGRENRIAWYENDGDGAFSGRKTITTKAHRARSVYAADLDSDSDLDVLSASLGDEDSPSKVAWYENDGSESFSSQKTITTNVNGANSVFVADLDGDADVDALSASRGDNKIAWYENTPSTLPVDLAQLGAQVTGEETVLLNWQTASEQNNAGFDVQHKPPNSRTWRTLSFVESQALGGTTTEVQSYRYTAEDLPVGTHRFRLRQVDLDGSTSLSDPVTVKLQMQEAVRLAAPSPNPVSGTATISFAVKEKSKTKVVVCNVIGQQVRTLYKGTPVTGESKRLQFDTRGLASGTYFVRLEAEGKMRTRRLTVVR